MVSVNWFGDCVLLTPAFKAIKQKYNTSYVAVMAPQRVSGLFEDNPSIDEVIIFDESLRPTALAKEAETIPYEIFTSVGERVRRSYLLELG